MDERSRRIGERSRRVWAANFGERSRRIGDERIRRTGDERTRRIWMKKQGEFEREIKATLGERSKTFFLGMELQNRSDDFCKYMGRLY